MNRPLTSALARVAALLVLAGCGDPEPRYGDATLSESAPRLTLSGTTFGDAAALELAPGCPGYLDADTPGHVVHVSDPMPFRVQARSEVGPLAIAVARGDEVQCDSDEGSGHTPSLSFRESGDYLVYVAALREPSELPYELTVRTVDAAEPEPTDDGSDEPVATGPTEDITVTMTSDPPGAAVTDADGEQVGTTPAMFVVHAPESELGRDHTWTLTLAGYEPVEVTGTLRRGALVLHGQLSQSGPVSVEEVADAAQPIRDYSSATLSVDVSASCAVSEAEVEVALTHEYVRDLRVVLNPPSGAPVELRRHQSGVDALRETWSSSSAPLSAVLGRNTHGRWSLSVHDDANGDEGRLERFRLALRCGPVQVADATPPSTDVQQPWASPTRPSVTPPRPTPPRPTPPRPPRPRRLPDLPSRADIVQVLSALRPRVESCGTGGGNARILATVSGRNGRVTHISSSGSATAEERQCVERVVRTARFPRFRRANLDVDYTYDLPARSQPTQL